MAYNTKPILTDTNKNPISQYYNKELDQYEPVEGQAGANKVIVYKSDGTESNISLAPILDKLSQLTGTVIDEETRKSNELERIDNEDARQSNEDIRNTNEIERVNNEDIRIENENTRIKNENIRKANEQNRVELYNDLINKVNSGYFDGKNLEFHWRGTELGVRVEGETEYIYVDLKGETGDIENLTGEHIVTALGYTPASEDELNALAGEGRTTETVKQNADDIVIVQEDLDEHKAESASQDNVHGLREDKIILGNGAHQLLDSPDVIIGKNARYERKSLTSRIGGNVIIGNGASVTLGESVAIGYGATAHQESVAIGKNSYSSSSNNLAIGHNARAEAINSVALGCTVESLNIREGILGTETYAGTNIWIVPGNFTVNGTKNFEIPHPKPEKRATHRIRHGAVESPTAGDTLYRWKIQATKDNDLQYIDLPDYFIYLNKDVQIFVTPQGHFGNGYGVLNEETEQLEIHCQFEGEYNVLVIGTRNDDHQSVKDWDIKGVEREIGESWTGETYAFSVDEIIEIEEIKEVSA